MKTKKILYYVATVMMSLIFTFSAGMYFLNYERVSTFFVNLGFPTWLIYPLAVLKVLGLIAVWSKQSKFLKDLAYAGFLFDAILALSAHVIANDGEAMGAIIATVATSVSWFYDHQLQKVSN